MSRLLAGGSSPLIVRVRDESQVGEARRSAAAAAKELGLSETRVGAVSIVATELGTNLVKHGQRGEIHIWKWRSWVDVLSIDHGPGMGDVARSLRDGYSTTATQGTGLGAIARLADEFDIHSQPGDGTVITARFHLARRAPGMPELGLVQTPAPGEAICGDAFGYRETEEGYFLMVADGLGHGPDARKASAKSVEVLFRATESSSPAEIMRDVHAALRPTRGAAVAIAKAQPNRQIVYCGIGNISGIITGTTGVKMQHLISHPGTAGHQAGKIRELSYAFAEDASLIMFSDGLHTSWSFDRYASLAARHPALIASVLYRDQARGRDDATVAVVRSEGLPFRGI